MPIAVPAMVRCDSCGASIFWAQSATTGKRMPIDEHPRSDGNVAITGNPRSLQDRVTLVAEVLGPLEALTRAGDGEELYVAHFVTCPDASSWQGTTRTDRRRRHKEHA